MRFNPRVIVFGLILLVLAGGAVFAGLRFFSDDAVRVLYLEPEEPGPDPFTEPAVLAADVTTTTTTTPAATPSPTPTQSPSPTSTLSPSPTASLIASPSPEATFAGSGRKGECDSELLIRLLNGSPERKAAWVEVLSGHFDEFEEYVRSLRPATLIRDARVTSHGFRDGEAYAFQAILARGTAVLVDEQGEIVVRCYSGSPLLPPQELEEFECEGCPADYELPPACNRTCYAVVTTTTTTTAPVTETTIAPTTTRRVVTTTRRPTTTTRRPVTTAPPPATQPTTQPATMPTTTTAPPTTSTGISESPSPSPSPSPPSEN